MAASKAMFGFVALGLVATLVAVSIFPLYGYVDMGGSGKGKREISLPQIVTGAEGKRTYTGKAYNRMGAYGYAYRWWNGRNPHYNDFSSMGGDCANFVSQCLIAGGLSLHEGTDGAGYGVYPDVDRPSISSNGTIPYCDYLDQHLRNYQDAVATYVTDTNPYVPGNIEVGDVVIFGDKSGDKYKHAMIVVWVGENDCGLAAHTSDRWNISFWTELSYFSCATFYHIPVSSAGYYHFRVDTGTLNVRVGAGKNALGDYYQDIGDIHNGEEYIAFGYALDDQGRKWWHFWYDDRAAWCAAWYTTEVSGNTVFEVEVDAYLNVRTGPSTSYTIVGQVYDGMRFVATAMEGEWYRYYYSGGQYYSHSGYTYVIDENVSSNPPGGLAPGSTVLGFWPYWTSGYVNYTLLTHIAWFSVGVNSDGSISNTHGWPDWDIINAAKANGTKVLLTATCFDSTTIHTILTTYKQTTANNLLSYVQMGNADGLVIDFEFPKSADDRTLLVQFAQILNQTFKSANESYYIALCTSSEDWWDTFDYGSLAVYFDALIMMGYSYYWSGSSTAGPVAPLEGGTYNVKNSIQDHINKGAPPGRIVLGVPYYGYDWPTVDDTYMADTRGSGSARFYSSAMDLASTYGATINFDDTYKVPWFKYYKSGDGWHQVWFDNYTSLGYKYDYALATQLQGIGIWALGYDDGHTELWDLLRERFFTPADTTPPTVTITAPVNNTYINTTSVSVSWDGSDDNGISLYRIRVDGGSWTDNGLATSHTLTDLSEGPHAVEVEAVDVANNTAIAVVNFYVDTHLPEVEILLPNEGDGFNTDTVGIYWQGTDNTGIDHYELTWTGAVGWMDVGAQTSYNITGLSNGTYGASVRAIDVAGNSAMDVVNFTVSIEAGVEDTTPPSIYITYPTNGSIFNTSTVPVRWIATDNSGVTTQSISLDNASWTNIGLESESTFSALEDGGHNVRVRSSDASGNSATAAVNFKVDTTPPVLRIVEPVEGAVLPVSDVIVTIEWDDNVGLDRVEVSTDLGPWENIGLAKEYILRSCMCSGHIVAVRAFDMAGNSAMDMVNFTVDAIAPELEIVYPVDGEIIGNDTLRVVWNATDNLGIGHCSVKVDDGPWVNTGQVSNWTLYGLSNGAHNLQVMAFDKANNSVSASVTVVVDTLPPEVEILAPNSSAILNTDFVVVKWNGSDTTTGIDFYRLYLDSHVVYNGSMSEVMLTNLSEGPHTIEVACYDLGGNMNVTEVTIIVVYPTKYKRFDIVLGPTVFENGSYASGVNITLQQAGKITAAARSDPFAHFNNITPGIYNGTLQYGSWTAKFILVVYSNGTTLYDLPRIPVSAPHSDISYYTLVVGPLRDINGDCVAGARVFVLYNGRYYNTTTNASGYATLRIPSGIYGAKAMVTITCEGYMTHTSEATINEDMLNATRLQPLEGEKGGGEGQGGVERQSSQNQQALWLAFAIIAIAIVLAALYVWLKGGGKGKLEEDYEAMEEGGEVDGEEGEVSREEEDWIREWLRGGKGGV